MVDIRGVLGQSTNASLFTGLMNTRVRLEGKIHEGRSPSEQQ
jgi:hypothetical protein